MKIIAKLTELKATDKDGQTVINLKLETRRAKSRVASHKLLMTVEQKNNCSETGQTEGRKRANPGWLTIGEWSRLN